MSRGDKFWKNVVAIKHSNPDTGALNQWLLHTELNYGNQLVEYFRRNLSRKEI